MAHTKVTKTGTQNTGTANTFSYSGSFDVFKASEVEVELDNVKLTFTTSTINESASPREYTVDYSAKTIHIGGANLAGTNTVVIQPVTDMGAPTPRATYEPGSSVTSADLNNNQLQLMRKAMEYDEQKLSSRGGTMTGNLHFAKDIDITFEGDTDNAYETTLTVADPTADRTITLPDTTGTVVTTGDTGTVTATMLAANSVDSSELVDGSIDTSHIGNLQVTTDKIAADAVTGAKIADDAINSEHYTDGSIDTAHIADSQVTTAKIADTAVTTAKITDGNVTTAKIAADAITAAKIADDVVNSEHYAAGSIDTEHIADSQITTAKIAADAVTNAKIADDQIDSEHYVDGSIDTAHIGDSQVTTAKIADANVTTAKLATDAVTTVKITDANVTTAKIAADAVTGAKIADDAVDSEHLAADSIDAEHYAAASVDTTALGSNAVTTAKITDANVTTVKIADSNVTLAKLANDLKQTSISNSDTQLPTSGAVVDYVAAQIAPLGGLEVIADEDNFPTSQPASGVVISISDAAGIVVNGSGVSTTARTAGNGSDNVTINNFPSSLYGETLASGVGLMVSSTGSSQTYNYHKILAAETDVKQLSDDINDFNARYRVAGSAPSSSLDEGDLWWDTATDKLKVYDGSSWEEVASSGDFYINTISSYSGTGGNSATFNGSAYRFVLSNPGSYAQQHIVSINGVIQKPNSGTSQPSEGFVIDGSSIIFSNAPATGSDYFILTLGTTVSIGTPSDGTVTAAKIASGAVTTAKIADANVTKAKIENLINNNADNRIITGSGTANTLNGEASLTYDSGGMAITGDTDRDGLKITQSGNNYGEFMFNSNRSSSGNALGVIRGEWNSTEVASIYLSAGSDTTNKDDGQIRFFTSPDSGTGIQTRMLIDPSGNVGIGTTSPVRQLHVNDSAHVKHLLLDNGAGGSDVGTTPAIYSPASATLAFSGGSAERMRIDSSGRIGIGTTSPSSFDSSADDLVINGSGNTGITINSGATTSTSEGNLVFAEGNGSGGSADEWRGAIQYKHGDDYMRFYTDNTERMRITTSGIFPVPHGQTFNSSQLPNGNTVQINTTSSSHGFSMTRYSSNYAGYAFNIGRSKSDTIGTNTIVADGDDLGHITWYGADGTDFNQAAAITAQVDGGPSGGEDMPGRLIFKTSGDGSATPTERMRIATDGLVNIRGKSSSFGIQTNHHAISNNNATSWALQVVNTGSLGYGMEVRVNADTASREAFYIYSTSASEAKASILTNGTFYSRSNTYTSYSDVKLKENIVDAKSQWNDIKAIKVRNFNFKTDDPSKKMLGVVAQELEAVCPNLVENIADKETNTNGERVETGTTTKSVKYSILYMKAIKALQEAITKIETLETKVAALEAA